MHRFHFNKKNNKVGNVPIDHFYKVVKRPLFDLNKSVDASPVFKSMQQSPPGFNEDDSPLMYDMSKKKNGASKLFPESISTSAPRTINETPLKRSGSIGKQRVSKKLPTDIMETSEDIMDMSYDIERFGDVSMESPQTSVKKMVEMVMETDEKEAMSGDFSQKRILPTINGKHPDLNTINVETVAELIVGDHNYDVLFIDCRYPYEYCAGHIKGAINLFTKERVDKDYFDNEFIEEGMKCETILIFYCEFSSERAPNMMRYFRDKDRSLNAEAYPFVFYPEMYLIEGGYKTFFTTYQDLCVPQNYKPMLCRENKKDYLIYRNISKGWICKEQNDEK